MKRKINVIFSLILVLFIIFPSACAQKDETKEIHYNDIESGKPLIVSSAEFLYAAVGDNVKLPAISAYDGKSSVEVKTSMFFGQEEIDVTNGFVPDCAGEYNYSVKAENEKGCTEKEIPIYVENDHNDYKNKLSSFDKPVGVKQVGFLYGRSSYSRNMAINGEDGSLKLELNERLSGQSYEFILTNLDEEDWSDYDAIYFYCYNSSESNLQFYINWVKSYTLQAETWTRVEINRADLQEIINNASYTEVAENVTIDNVNGLNFNILHDVGAIVKHDDAVYLSSIRGLNNIDYLTLQDKIDVMLQSGFTTAEMDEVDYYYNALTEEQKTKVENFGKLKQLYVEKMMKDYGVDAEKDKVLYFDSDFGSEKQLKLEWGVSSMSVSSEKLYRGNETLKITTDSTGDFGISVVHPAIYDLSEYQLLEINIFNAFDKDVLFYNSDANYKNWGQSCNFILKAGQWNKFVIPLTEDNRNIYDSLIWLRMSDWSPLPADVSFYFASVYADTFKNLLSGLNSSKDFSDASYISSVISVYQSLSEAEKISVKTEYEQFINDYIEYLASAAEADTVISFDTEIGALQVSQPYGERATTEYTEEIKKDGEKGSTKFTSVMDADFALKFDVSFIDDLTDFSNLTISIYYTGSRDYRLYLIEDYDSMGEGYIIGKEGWTDIEIDVSDISSLSGKMLVIMDSDWRFYTGDVIFISSIKAKK